MFQGKDKVNTTKIQLLRRDCENMNMKDSDSVESFFTYVVGIVNQIRSHGEI